MMLAAGFLLVIWLFYLFVYLPQRQRIAAIAAQYELENRRVGVIAEFARSYPQPEKYYAELNQRLRRVNQLLPDNHELSEFLVQVEQAAKAAQAEGDALYWPIYNLDLKNPHSRAGLEHADPKDLIASMRSHEAEVLRLLGEIEALVGAVDGE